MIRALIVLLALSGCQRALCELQRGNTFCQLEVIDRAIPPTVDYVEVCYCVITISHSWRYR